MDNVLIKFLVITCILIDCNSEIHNHPLSSSSFYSNFQQHNRGRARIYNYEDDVDWDITSRSNDSIIPTYKSQISEIIHHNIFDHKSSIIPTLITNITPYLETVIIPSTSLYDKSKPCIHTTSSLNDLQLTFPPSHSHHTDNKMILEKDAFTSSCLNPNSSKQKYRKTGTTIVGCIAENTVIIAADTRATEGSIVADKQCEKVHQLSNNVWACGAGTSGDLDALVKKVKYTFLLRGRIEQSIGNGIYLTSNNDILKELQTTKNENEMNFDSSTMDDSLLNASVYSICRFIVDDLYKGGGEIGANLVLGGYDYGTNQAVLVAIHPHGSIDFIPYTALGSGGLAAMGILESRYKSTMSVQEAIDLVKDAVYSGIENDLGSGSSIDLCIISKSGVVYTRGIVNEEELFLTEKDENIDVKVYKQITSTEKVEKIDGVNGFGSLPYFIKSKRLIVQDEEKLKCLHAKWLDDLLMD